MNVLPQASATGNIHIGTIAGKLNGVMPAHTPTGWRSEKLSTPVPTLSLKSPFSRCGMPVANSTTSMPRVIEPSASAERLAVLLRYESRQVRLVRFHQLAKAHQDARAAQRRCGAPGGQCSGGGCDGGVDVGGVAQRNVAEHFAGRRDWSPRRSASCAQPLPGRRSTAAGVRVSSSPCALLVTAIVPACEDRSSAYAVSYPAS